MCNLKFGREYCEELKTIFYPDLYHCLLSQQQNAGKLLSPAVELWKGMPVSSQIGSLVVYALWQRNIYVVDVFLHML